MSGPLQPIRVRLHFDCGNERRELRVSVFGVSWLGGLRRCVVLLGVASVSLVFAGVSWGDSSYDAATDSYSMYNLTAQMGASTWWNAGYAGQGVDVAVIDTGVAPVQGLNGPGKVVYGPDLSLESQSSFANLDTNGHGTFMAGLIAGHDPSVTGQYSSAPSSAYLGVAPDARIVSVKVGDADGGVDVTQVIAGIDWVVQHAHDPGMNIRVINLSYGTQSANPYTSDPLAYAAEQAWKHGIVVVAAGGNTGSGPGAGKGLTDPAYDPYVIGAGGYNTLGTGTIKDDIVASYSATSKSCSGCKNPDLIGPGTHMVGLRVPGSYIDQTHGEAALGAKHFRGSGTSEAAAITSGAVALLLSKYPDLSPDEVKAMLTSTAPNIGGEVSQDEGAGELGLAALAGKADPNGAAAGTYCAGNFTGKAANLEVSRDTTCTLAPGSTVTGDVKVDPGGTLNDLGASIGGNLKSDHALSVAISGGSVAHDLVVQYTYGAVTVQGAKIGHNLTVTSNPGAVTVSGNSVAVTTNVAKNGSAAPALAALPSGPNAQTFPSSTGTGSLEKSRGGEHISMDGVQLSGNQDIFGQPVDTSALAQAEALGSSWSGGTWNGSSWSGSSWSGSSWSGSSWSGSSWSGSSWSGSSWSGSSWSGNSWSGSSWSGSSWSGSSWSGNDWSGAEWAGVSWG
jgi:serine protease AprX